MVKWSLVTIRKVILSAHKLVSVNSHKLWRKLRNVSARFCRIVKRTLYIETTNSDTEIYINCGVNVVINIYSYASCVLLCSLSFFLNIKVVCGSHFIFIFSLPA